MLEDLQAKHPTRMKERAVPPPRTKTPPRHSDNHSTYRPAHSELIPLQVWYTVDRPPAKWGYSTGFITATMISEHLPPPADDTLVLMYGPLERRDHECTPRPVSQACCRLQVRAAADGEVCVPRESGQAWLYQRATSGFLTRGVLGEQTFSICVCVSPLRMNALHFTVRFFSLEDSLVMYLMPHIARWISRRRISTFILHTVGDHRTTLQPKLS